MKYLCLGYIEPGTLEGMTEDERHAVLDECFEYNDHLRANGHVAAEVPLQPPETAVRDRIRILILTRDEILNIRTTDDLVDSLLEKYLQLTVYRTVI